MAKYLYRAIAEKIIQEISSGQLLPGEPVPSSRKLSQRYGVNQLTTIRALSFLAQKGILTHFPHKNYCVSRKVVKEENSWSFITLLFRYISQKGPEFYGNKIFSGASSEAASANIGTYLAATSQRIYHQRKQDCSEILSEALALVAQNIGFVSDYFVDDKVLEEILKETNLPIALIGRISKLPNIHSVVIDATIAYQTMLNTLKRLGYNSFICCQQYPTQLYEHQQQEEFYTNLAKKEENVSIITKFNQISESQRIEKLAIEIEKYKDARKVVFCSSDSEARVVINYLSNMGFKVPDDIGVVGFYGTRVATEFSPKLSCLAVHPELLGKTAALLLISKDEKYRVHKIPMEFIFGETI